MNLNFSKYHGAGNDFIIIDNREGQFVAEQTLIKNLCHRQFGIGADGLMLLENEPNADFLMRYFNSDGKESTMCGNGGRCIAVFANRIGIIKMRTRFLGIDGEHSAIITKNGQVKLKMKDVDGVNTEGDYFFLNTGSPHCVCFVENVDGIEVDSAGRIIRNSFFKESGGVNVNFVEIVEQGLKIRTYERGVEAETLACGTGSVAASIAASLLLESQQSSYKIFARGGVLNVSFDRGGENIFRNIWLEGPVAHVFDGGIDIP